MFIIAVLGQEALHILVLGQRQEFIQDPGGTSRWRRTSFKQEAHEFIRG